MCLDRQLELARLDPVARVVVASSRQTCESNVEGVSIIASVSLSETLSVLAII